MTLPTNVSLNGLAFDDGTPPGSTLSYNWSEVSGPGTASFSIPTALATTASFSNAGTYEASRLTVSDGRTERSRRHYCRRQSPFGCSYRRFVNPNTGQQGQQDLSVAITGQNTNPVQGTTQVNLGSGITTNSVTVTDSTDLITIISIDSAAALGGRDVILTTNAEVATLPGDCAGDRWHRRSAAGDHVNAPRFSMGAVIPNGDSAYTSLSERRSGLRREQRSADHFQRRRLRNTRSR